MELQASIAPSPAAGAMGRLSTSELTDFPVVGKLYDAGDPVGERAQPANGSGIDGIGARHIGLCFAGGEAL